MVVKDTWQLAAALSSRSGEGASVELQRMLQSFILALLRCSAKMLGRSFVALSSWLLWILRACNYCRRPKEGRALQSENSQDSAEDSQLRGRHCVDQILETSGMHPFEHVASLLIWQLKADFSPSRTVKDIYRSYVQLYIYINYI